MVLPSSTVIPQLPLAYSAGDEEALNLLCDLMFSPGEKGEHLYFLQ